MAGEEEEDGAAPSSPPQPQPRILPSHDRAKALPLPPDEPDPFLQRLGLQGPDGKARADGRRKLAQVNALLRLLDATGAMEMEEDDEDQAEEVHVLDAGCGASVLTFGVYRHLQKKAAQRRAERGSAVAARVRLTGVDTNAALMRRSVEAARELLDPSDPPASFLAMPIRDYGRSDSDAPSAPPPDLVLALHACDQATDEALALAVRTRARLALAVPCCMVSMHRDYALAVKGSTAKDDDSELEAAVARAASRRRKQEAGGATPPSELPLAALLRHGILKQRLLDLATDSLRAALLRCLGYSADAVEFVSTEHTPRNLLLRSALPRREWQKAAAARKAGVAPPPLPLDRAAVREYKAMRAFFGGVAPALEAMLERDGQLPKGWLEDEE
jgi:SAM-dependent methyltransferase